MNLALAIKQIFPTANPQTDFIIMDEGEGQYIAEWHIKAQEPTNEELYLSWLELLKQKKINELNQKCNETIVGKFQVTINDVTYSFSHDTEAQSNFSSAKLAFLDNTMESIGWTAYNENGNLVRLVLDKPTFDQVYLGHLTHIQTHISKYRDILQPQVESAMSENEIDLVVW